MASHPHITGHKPYDKAGNDKTLVLEIKGVDSERNRAKRAALDEWVRAVNQKGGFGQWCWGVAFEPEQVQDVLATHCK